MPQQSHKATFTVHVAASGVSPIVFAPDGGPLPDEIVGSPVNQLVTQVSGGTPPYSFSVTSGAIPPGLALDSSLMLTGTPTQAGDFSFEVTATDSTP
jgi:hypothetical protein